MCKPNAKARFEACGNWCGWIAPDGELVGPFGYTHHRQAAQRAIQSGQIEPILGLEDADAVYTLYIKGYIHVGDTVAARHKPTKLQIDALIDWADAHSYIWACIKGQGNRIMDEKDFFHGEGWPV